MKCTLIGEGIVDPPLGVCFQVDDETVGPPVHTDTNWIHRKYTN